MNAIKRHMPFPILALAIVTALCATEFVHWNGQRLHTRPHHGELPNAYFVVRADECEGVFDFLSIFERQEIAHRIYFDGIYVLGNYNATGVSAVGTPTQPAQYTGTQVPASVVADAITVLSN